MLDVKLNRLVILFQYKELNLFVFVIALKNLFCFSILEEMTKAVLLGVVLWAGLTFGSHVAPYPLNLIIPTSGES